MAAPAVQSQSVKGVPPPGSAATKATPGSAWRSSPRLSAFNTGLGTERVGAALELVDRLRGRGLCRAYHGADVVGRLQAVQDDEQRGLGVFQRGRDGPVRQQDQAGRGGEVRDVLHDLVVEHVARGARVAQSLFHAGVARQEAGGGVELLGPERGMQQLLRQAQSFDEQARLVPPVAHFAQAFDQLVAAGGDPLKRQRPMR
jgi:hypothetical protein